MTTYSCLLSYSSLFFSSGPHLMVDLAWKYFTSNHTFREYECGMKNYSKIIHNSLAPLRVAD